MVYYERSQGENNANGEDSYVHPPKKKKNSVNGSIDVQDIMFIYIIKENFSSPSGKLN